MGILLTAHVFKYTCNLLLQAAPSRSVYHQHSGFALAVLTNIVAYHRVIEFVPSFNSLFLPVAHTSMLGTFVQYVEILAPEAPRATGTRKLSSDL